MGHGPSPVAAGPSVVGGRGRPPLLPAAALPEIRGIEGGGRRWGLPSATANPARLPEAAAPASAGATAGGSGAASSHIPTSIRGVATLLGGASSPDALDRG